MKRILILFAALTLSLSAVADEGMWLLPLIQQMNKKDLKAAGCKLSPQEIYNINKSSLKDAIVQFGGGCTGEMISNQGLLVTNHHCGYGSIQGLSTDEHNYLMEGYWANERAEEIPVPGLSVTFLVSMEDVTAQMEAAEDPETTRREIIAAATEKNPQCRAVVTGFYNENIYYLIIYRTYRDVRFVGAPPASMGKFGGETDNWMWPRHTCDFSMFRVYADKNNMPADYDVDNVPYRPAHSLKISLKGPQENDYAMIMGYPGRTQRYQTAAQLEQMIATNRIRIDARTVRQDLMWEAMCADPSVQLKYANKYAGSANGWKKWQGEELAFKNLNIIGREEEKEAALKAWIAADPVRAERYGTPIEDIAAYVAKNDADNLAVTLLSEAPSQIELLSMYSALVNAYGRAHQQDNSVTMQSVVPRVESRYRDYVAELDRKEAVALLEFYRKNAKAEDYLEIPGEDFATMDIPAYVNNLFDNSVFTSYEKLSQASEEELLADPVAGLMNSVTGPLMKHYMALYGSAMRPGPGGRPGAVSEEEAKYNKARKNFAAALMEWQKGQAMYPDANSTMRLTYGHVLPYSPKDGLKYLHYTTLKGVMEKEDPTNPEFIVPAKVKELYEAGDYGRWADADGTLHTCFLTNNDITGGNSGSPVLDANGNLIGLAFDGNWESMSSDVMFEPELQRCICVDIRYVLWMVEKFGGATNLINELSYVK
ncbi:MAG: S46 family peptidase [Bacteroidales bacterium]|nr:S46 family peptidase [Bacteroidales bacterium]